MNAYLRTSSKWPKRVKKVRNPPNPPPARGSEPYHPYVHTDVTKWLKRVPPSHALHFSSHLEIEHAHRRREREEEVEAEAESAAAAAAGAASVKVVMGIIPGDGKPRVGRRRVEPINHQHHLMSSPPAWFGRSCTDVSEHLHRAPPSHPAGQDSDKTTSGPKNNYYDPEPTKGTSDQPTHPPMNHWWRDHKSGAAPVTVPPQYVSREDLFAALPQRRRDVEQQPPDPKSHEVAATELPRPVSVEVVDVHTPRSIAGTPRSVLDTRDLKSSSSKWSEPARLSVNSMQGGATVEAKGGQVPNNPSSRPCSSRSSRSKDGGGKAPPPTELVRPRFSAGGVVRPSPMPELHSIRSKSRSSSHLSPSPRTPLSKSSHRPAAPSSSFTTAAGQNGRYQHSNNSPRVATPSPRMRVGYPASFVQHNHPWRG